MDTELSRALNDAVVRRLAGTQNYGRGQGYFRSGHVESLETEANCIRTKVRDGHDFTVSLTSDDAVLDYSCDCPQGAGGTFCAHVAAAALAWLNRGNAPAPPAPHAKVRHPTLADAEKVLLSEDKETVIRLILDWARDNPRLCEHILQFTAYHLGPETSIVAAARAFSKAVQVHDYVLYREAEEWAGSVDQAIDNISRVLTDGYAAVVIEPCERALQQLDAAAGSVDDSDGHLSYLRDRLQTIHLRACEEARPDPVALARRLFNLEMDSALDAFSGAAQQYAEILGDSGLQEYSRLAEVQWRHVPVRTARTKSADSSDYFRITRIMESLAKVKGDTEGLVAVISRDLSHAYNYLRIAQVYSSAGQPDQALLWAEKGLKAFPDRTDSRLRAFAADEYHRRGLHGKAMELMWAEFSERLFLETYKTLEAHATRAGAWPEWRERALTEVRGRITKANVESPSQAKVSHLLGEPVGHSQLVEIYLYENDVESAWREAQAGGCYTRLWLQLAAAREISHPEDAAPIYCYCRLAVAAVTRARNGNYKEAVELLAKAAAVGQRTGQSGEFVRWLEALRAQYKVKRNFIKLLEHNRASLYLA